MHILLAEDDRSVRRLVVTELGRRGFTVLDAEDGRADFPFIQERAGNRYVVLVDELVNTPVALEAALHAIGGSARAARRPDVRPLQMDRLRDAVARAIEVGELFRSLESTLASQVESLQQVRKRVQDMEARYTRALDDARAALAPAA